MVTSNLVLEESEELRMEHLQYDTFGGVDDDVAYYDDDDNWDMNAADEAFYPEASDSCSYISRIFMSKASSCSYILAGLAIPKCMNVLQSVPRTTRLRHCLPLLCTVGAIEFLQSRAQPHNRRRQEETVEVPSQ